VDTSSAFSRNQRLKIALGGFMSFTGFLILAMVILTATGSTNLESIIQNQVVIGVVATLGFLDVFCGILLYFREKNLRLLIPSHKKEPDNYVDQTDKTPNDQTG
jgi:hypothetical protein